MGVCFNDGRYATPTRSQKPLLRDKISPAGFCVVYGVRVMRDQGPAGTPGEPLMERRREKRKQQNTPASEVAGYTGGENPLITVSRVFEKGKNQEKLCKKGTVKEQDRAIANYKYGRRKKSKEALVKSERRKLPERTKKACVCLNPKTKEDI